GDRLLEERHDMVIRTQCGGSVGGPLERDTCLRAEGVSLRSFACIGMSREVVPRQRAGQLIRPYSLEVARCREMARLAILLRESVVGDLPDECLNEDELAALGRTRVHLAG